MHRPSILGIHHLKFPVAELARAVEFYERAFGAERIAAYDHIDANGRLFAIILSVPGLGAPLELRLNPAVAARHQGFDPVTFLVGGRADLAKWVEHFASTEVPHSEILVGAIGWLVVVQDPDGRRLRLYTREAHGPEEKVSWSSPWLQES